MANCGTCNSNSICTCDTFDSSTTLALGNGSLTHPFQFFPTDAADPRPIGYIQRTGGVNFFLNQPIDFDLDATSFNGGMVDLNAFPTRLTAPIDGLYLVGFNAYVTNLVDVTLLSMPISKNGLLSNVQVTMRPHASETTFSRAMSTVMLMDLNAGEYIEVFVQGSTGDFVFDETVSIGGGFFTDYNCRPTFWAVRVGDN